MSHPQPKHNTKNVYSRTIFIPFFLEVLHFFGGGTVFSCISIFALSDVGVFTVFPPDGPESGKVLIMTNILCFQCVQHLKMQVLSCFNKCVCRHYQSTVFSKDKALLYVAHIMYIMLTLRANFLSS